MLVRIRGKELNTMVTTIYLTRHGQTEWNLERRLQGRGNSPLTSFGIERARELGERLKEIELDAIYVSPIERALHTAHILKGDKKIEITSHEGLMEMSFGEYEGQKLNDIKKRDPKWCIEEIMKGNLTMRAPKGETLREVRNRVKDTMTSILKENKGKTILVVAHGITLKALMYYFQDKDVNGEVMGQATLTKILVEEDGNFKIVYKNDDSHFTIKEKQLGW